MRKKLVVMFLIYLILLSAGLIYAQIFLTPKLKTLLEEKASAALLVPVQIGSVHISYWPPLGIEIKDLEFEQKAFGIKLKAPMIHARVPISLELIKQNLDLELTLKDLDVTIRRPQPVPADAQATPPVDIELPGLEFKVPEKPRLGVSLHLENAHIHTLIPTGADIANEIHLDPLNFSWKFQSLQDVMTLNLQSGVQAKVSGTSFDSPISVESQVQWSNETQTLALKKLSGSLSIFEFQASGESHIKSAKHNYTAHFSVSDFQKAREYLPKDFPLTWSGGGEGDLSYEKVLGSPPTTKGHLQIDRLIGNVKFKRPDFDIEGPFSLRAAVNFAEVGHESTLTFDQAIDLTNATFRYKDMVNKLPQTAFLQSARGSFKLGQIMLAPLIVQIGNLKASTEGSLQTQLNHAFNFRISIPKAPLAGLEKVLTPLASAPLKGFLEAQIEAVGNTENLKTLSLKLAPITLDQAEATLNFKNPKIEVHGPVQMKGKAEVELKGSQILAARIDGLFNFSGLAIRSQDHFNKPAGAPMTLDVVAKKQGDDLKIALGHIVSAPFVADIAGSIRSASGKDPALNLQLKIPRLDLAKLTTWVPLLVSHHLTGTMTSSLNINGTYDLDLGFEKSPLSGNGAVTAVIPSYSYEPPKAAASEGTPGAKGTAEKQAVPPEPILLDWPFFKNLKLTQDLTIQSINYLGAKFEGFHWKGQLASGVLTGESILKKIFEGSLKAPIKYSLVEKAPSLRADLTFEKIRIERALATFLPAWKDLASGSTSGKISFNLAHSSRKDFLAASQAKGAVKILGGSLKTLPFKKMIDEKLSKIPKIGSSWNPPAQIESSTIESQFAFFNSKLTLSLLKVLANDKSELNSAGWVAPDKTFDLQGNIYLANPPVQGPFLKANSDPLGRLIVPIHLDGSVLSPQFNALDSTFQVMISRTLKSEGDRLKSQAQQQLKQEVEKKTQDLKNQLEEQAKKALGF